MWFSHPSYFYSSCDTLSHGYTGGPNRFHSMPRNRLTSYNGCWRKRFSRESWKGANLHNGLTTSEQFDAGSERLYILFTVLLHLIPMSPFEFYAIPTFVSCIRNCCVQCPLFKEEDIIQCSFPILILIQYPGTRNIFITNLFNSIQFLFLCYFVIFPFVVNELLEIVRQTIVAIPKLFSQWSNCIFCGDVT